MFSFAFDFKTETRAIAYENVFATSAVDAISNFLDQNPDIEAVHSVECDDVALEIEANDIIAKYGL